jgi:hypothetical protein
MKPKRKQLKKSLEEKSVRELMAEAQPVHRLTEKIITTFAEKVRKGIPGSVVADYLGIPNSVFHGWIAKGDIFYQTADPKYVLYGLFIKRYRRALAEYLESRQEKLHEDDNKLFYREIVILERRDPKNWRKDEPISGPADALQADERFL